MCRMRGRLCLYSQGQLFISFPCQIYCIQEEAFLRQVFPDYMVIQ
jgi:hypothetical protein